MEPRQVHRLAGLPDEKLIEQIALGLDLINEHVAELQTSVETLAQTKQPRGVAAVRTIADEEAAKFLILVDAIRCPRRAQKQRARQLRRCNDHIAKGIYAYISGMAPADLDEIRRIVEGLRVSHYLDGPMDVDWIFRNEIEERRERILYVDYVHSDDGDEWVAPDVHDEVLFLHGDPTGVVRIVQALARAGLTSEAGLRVIAEIWRDFVPEGNTHWQEVARRNQATVRRLLEEVLASDEFSQRDASIIIDEWTFPLHHEDLSRIRVDIDELRQRQADWDPDGWDDY